MLITCGHGNAWDYGYSFFKVALKSVQRLQKEIVKLQAMAIGLALGGKKEDWQRFLKED